MRANEGSLFDRWRESLPNEQRKAFVTDGAVDFEAYEKTNLRILLLLKEANDLYGGGWCLRDLLRNGDRKPTWDTVTRWLRAIRRLPTEVSWPGIGHLTKALRCGELRSIAAMNLKKTPGHHTTDLTAWSPVVKRDQAYLREQFAVYQADLVICCGTEVTDAFNQYMKPKTATEWLSTPRGVDYVEYTKGKYVIAYSHPEARVARNLIHYGLIDAVREILHSDKRTSLAVEQESPVSAPTPRRPVSHAPSAATSKVK